MNGPVRLVGILLLGWVGTESQPGRGAEPPAELTKEQQKQLQAEADNLDEQVSLSHHLGDFEGTIRLAEQSLRIRERIYPADKYPKGHLGLVNSAGWLAFLQIERGDYVRALPLCERNVAICEAFYPKERYPLGHPDLAKSIHNLAALHEVRGDYGRALPLYERALAMDEGLYPKERYPQGHAELAISLNNLGHLHRTRGEYGKALPLCERALAMREGLYLKDRDPQSHADLAISIQSLAALHLARGDHARALPLQERALAICEVLYPKEYFTLQGHPLLAQSIQSLAALHEARGDYGRALPLCERALAMCEALYLKDRYPLGHPGLALSVYNLAFLHHAQGDSGRALPLFQRASAMYESFATAVVETGSEAEALNFLASLPLTRDALLSLSFENPEVSAAYDVVWRDKSVLARLLEARHRDAIAARDPEARELFSRLRGTRRRLARLLLAPAGTAPDSAAMVTELTADKERLERELARTLPAAGRYPGTHAELARRLPVAAAYVDLLQYTRFEQDPKYPGKQGEKYTPSYVAFLLAPGRTVCRVELGPAKPVDDAVLAWRRALLDASDSPAAAELRRLVWEPVLRRLPAGTHTVYLAPDGALARLPWAALPGVKSGTVLLEEYALAVVPNGPALLDALRLRDRRTRADDTLLTVGHISYDREPHAVVAQADGHAGEQPRLAERGSGARWGNLEATGSEAGHVAALAAPRKVVALAGEDAGTARVSAELPKTRWAHLATHGFFADPTFRSAFRLDERLYDRTTRDRATPGARSPLVLSGLVLAGANKPDPSGDGGILTAEAIVGLDLSGMDLAVLSACETGLGEVAGGEGVYGLQRAFHIAGCRDVVASLWKVNDQATAALMAVFYRKLWKENLPPVEALRQAQLTIYRHPEQIQELAERGWDTGKPVKLPDTSTPAPAGQAPPKKAPAKLWAAFVLSGPGQNFPTAGK